MAQRYNWLPYRAIGALARLVGKLFPIEVVRAAPLPVGPAVFAFNHYSFMDGAVAGATGGRPILFLATDEVVGHFKAVDFAMRLFNVMSFDKSKVPIRPMRAALAALEDGLSVGIFPEGQRARSFGDTPLKRGGAWLAVRAGVPLVPVALVGTDRAMPIRDDLKLRFHRERITVWSGLPIMPHDHDEDTHAMIEEWRSQIAGAIDSVGGSSGGRGGQRAERPGAGEGI